MLDFSSSSVKNEYSFVDYERLHAVSMCYKVEITYSISDTHIMINDQIVHKKPGHYFCLIKDNKEIYYGQDKTFFGAFSKAAEKIEKELRLR